MWAHIGDNFCYKITYFFPNQITKRIKTYFKILDHVGLVSPRIIIPQKVVQ